MIWRMTVSTSGTDITTLHTPGTARFEYVEPLPKCPKEAEAINFCQISDKLNKENNRFIPRPLEKEDTVIQIQ